MRAHSTTSSSWQMIRKLDQVGVKMKKDLVCTIEGCPYDVNLEIVLSEKELESLGYFADLTEEQIAYGLEMHAPEKEVMVNFLLWDHISLINRVMDRHDTSGWGVHAWEVECPFLFECETAQDVDEDEEMQKTRETWT